MSERTFKKLWSAWAALCLIGIILALITDRPLLYLMPPFLLGFAVLIALVAWDAWKPDASPGQGEQP